MFVPFDTKHPVENVEPGVREFVELAFKAAGIEGIWLGVRGTLNEVYVHKTEKTPLVVVNPKFFRPAEVDVLLGDSTRARQELNWQPKTTFEQLVQKMVENDIRRLN